ncbi:c-type cytochrome (plasmid) [Klebsiella quasipneumoniae]|nr:c-type cytochrome [Klebsiella quasipneumoniae]
MALRQTPAAARGGHLKAGEGHGAGSAAPGASPILAGKKLFDNTCIACHSIAPNQNGIGPSLFGVVGRPAGSLPGFTYSEAMRNSGITWSAENLDKHLADTGTLYPAIGWAASSRVAAAGERESIIAYLSTLK